MAVQKEIFERFFLAFSHSCYVRLNLMKRQLLLKKYFYALV